MNDLTLHEKAVEAAVAITDAVPAFPKVAVVLGSGMGSLVEGLTETTSLVYGLIPHFPSTTVAGHRGTLAVGLLEGVQVAILQGRFHYYEGHDLDVVTFPIRVLQALGVTTLILTAATGGINADYRPGDLVAVSDHLNLLGSNPLRGPNEEKFGTRFPDMSEVYSSRLRGIAAEEAARLDITLHSGVYACMPGPSYETPAEIRMLRTLGADVVGMSTVPEAIAARHAGMEVLAFALASNWAAGISSEPITHAEVLEAGRQAGPRLGALITSVIGRLDRAVPPDARS